MIVLDGWTERAAALRDELVAAGKLTSPEWQAALLAVPRHAFVPEFYERGPDPVGPRAWERVSASSPDTRERWWNRVWANTPLVTQLGDVGRWGSQVTTGPTSSSSAPSLMTRMLEALDIRDGHRVLEIGTGTGYNAALMSHRLGAEKVFSVDVDAGLIASARDRLAALGYHPTLAAVDGVTGLPEHAPYDRLIATCAVSRVPWAWAEQTSEGGRILVDLKVHASVGNCRQRMRTGPVRYGKAALAACGPALKRGWSSGVNKANQGGIVSASPLLHTVTRSGWTPPTVPTSGTSTTDRADHIHVVARWMRSVERPTAK